MHYSDRRSQYASDAFQEALGAARIVCSMSRRGNCYDCYDNAVIESFFGTLKVERVHRLTFPAFGGHRVKQRPTISIRTPPAPVAQTRRG